MKVSILSSGLLILFLALISAIYLSPHILKPTTVTNSSVVAGVSEIFTYTSDIPIYPSATIVRTTREETSGSDYLLSTTDSSAEIAAFYNSALTATNWRQTRQFTTESFASEPTLFVEYQWLGSTRQGTARRYLQLGIIPGSKATELTITFGKWPHPLDIPNFSDAQQIETKRTIAPAGFVQHVTTYLSSESITTISNYYKEKMAALGWQQTGIAPDKLIFLNSHSTPRDPSMPENSAPKESPDLIVHVYDISGTGNSVFINLYPAKPGGTKVEITASGSEIGP